MELAHYRARKFTYDCASGRWEEQAVNLRMSHEPFGEGGMRVVYRAREILEDGSEVDAVVKRIKPGIGLDPDTNYHEAMTQMVAESYAQDFNKACAQQGLRTSIAFLPVSVIKIEGMPGMHEPLCLEPFLAGDYVKHSDNAGHIEKDDDVAAAFSYFTYINSEKLLVVCDIQGVGTFYTDPQIHTFDGEGFGAGNLGPEGLQRFVHTHRHNLLCEELGLPNPDAGLSDEELARKLQDVEDGMSSLGIDDTGMAGEGMPMAFGLGGSTVSSTSTWDNQQYRSGMTALAQMFARR